MLSSSRSCRTTRSTSTRSTSRASTPITRASRRRRRRSRSSSAPPDTPPRTLATHPRHAPSPIGMAASPHEHTLPSRTAAAAAAAAPLTAPSDRSPCRDPSEIKRTVADISWNSDGGRKIAAAFSIMQFQVGSAVHVGRAEAHGTAGRVSMEGQVRGWREWRSCRGRPQAAAHHVPSRSTLRATAGGVGSSRGV